MLDVIREVEEEEGEGEATDDQQGFVTRLRVQEEDRLMDVRTMVFGMGVSGDLRVGWVAFSLFLSLFFPVQYADIVSDLVGTNMYLTC